MNTIEKIFSFIKQTGKGLYTLEKEIGLKKGTLTNWDLGRTKNPSSDNLNKIANYFHVSVDYLLGQTDEMEKKPTSEEVGFKKFRNILESKGISEQDLESLDKEKLSAIADIIKNFKQ